MSTAREIAYDAFTQVMEHQKTPEEATEELYAARGQALKRLDRNFVKELVYGSLRWYSKIFWILQNTSNRDLTKSSSEIRAALVLGTYQIFYMDRVPDRAAVNESAEYVRMRGQAHAVSFVNGILRQIARRAEYFAKPDKKALPVEYLSLQFAHPQWIVRRWFQHFKFDRMEKMLASNNQPPPWTVRVNLMKTPITEVHQLQQRLLRDEKTHTDKRPLRSALSFKEPPHLEPDSLFGQGYYTIQDESSQLIALLVDPQDGQFIVDAAAGPGGKLSHVYELGQGKLQLLAIEKNPGQMLRAKQTMERLEHLQLEWLEKDFLEWVPDGKRPNKVLLDAPCSGLGVLRRHPEGKWQKQGSIVTHMAELQRKMIAHALGTLAPGGELIYSVCSFEPEETIGHVAWLREKFGDKIELISPLPRLPDYYKRYVTRDNLLVVYSGNQDEMDGFGAFIVKLKSGATFEPPAPEKPVAQAKPAPIPVKEAEVDHEDASEQAVAKTPKKKVSKKSPTPTKTKAKAKEPKAAKEPAAPKGRATKRKD
jgi:16S rRNA (cytosine967-C5)-methyltransferase